jgi:hypothetical protein
MPAIVAQGFKTLTKNNSRWINLNAERNSTKPLSLQANSTTKDLNTCRENEVSITELQKARVKMINELKEET